MVRDTHKTRFLYEGNHDGTRQINENTLTKQACLALTVCLMRKRHILFSENQGV